MTVTRVSEPASAESLSVDAEYDPRVSFALQQHGVPVVRTLEVHNNGPRRVTEVTVNVWSDPPVFEPWTGHIAAIDPGATYNLRDLALHLGAERLARQTEREAGLILVEVSRKGLPQARGSFPFEILAVNEWSGIHSLPELLAAFVLPNHPAIAEVHKRARVHLAQLTGDDALDGYQRRDPNRVLKIAGAIFAGVQELGLSYVNPPASFEVGGQKVRLPHQVLRDEMGTCLDLTLLLGAALEQAGLHPFVCVTDGHAFPGVWLSDYMLPEATASDPIAVRKRVDAGEAAVFESVALTQAVPFEQALATARTHLDDIDAFRCAIDIARARQARVRPLPLRHDADERWTVVPEAPRTERPASAPLAVPDIYALDPGDAPGQDASPASRLDRWKAKLLDLTLRNRLLNMRLTAKGTVPLLTADVAHLEDALADGGKFLLGHRPEPRPGQPKVVVAKDELTRLFERKRLLADLPEAELFKRLTGIYRDARSTLAESGSNTLYLALGVLSWFETDSAQTARLAPILLLPVQLVRGSVRDPFKLALTDDDPRVNTTLLKKLETDYGVDIAGLDALPEDESGLDIKRILARFQRAVMDFPKWEVKADAVLSQFSFTKYLMWLDLESRTETLLTNPLFKHILEGEGAPYPLEQPFTPPEALDRARPVRDDLGVVDADSSQLAAVFAAKDGNSFVLQGPPGTGKSQTITNLIAQLLAEEKTVLFVSEKMAALEVVHQRLDRVGLGAFCLELHSNASNKKKVVTQLAEPYQLSDQRKPGAWVEHAETLQRLRVRLNQHAQALHVRGPHGGTVFEAANQLARYEDAPVVALDIAAASDLEPGRLRAIRETLEQLRVAAKGLGNPSDHPWVGVAWRGWTPQGETQRLAALTALGEKLMAVSEAATEAANALGLTLATMDDAVLERLERACALLLDSPRPTTALLKTQRWPEAKQLTEDLRALTEARRDSWAEVEPHFEPALLTLDLPPLAMRYQRWADAFFLLVFFMLWGARGVLKPVAKTKLPPAKETRDALVEAVEVRRLDGELAKREPQATALMGGRWEQLHTDWTTVDETMAWVAAYRELVLDLGDEMAGGSLLGGPNAVARLESLATEGAGLLAEDKPRGMAMRHFLAVWRDYRGARTELFDALEVEPETRTALASLKAVSARRQIWLEHRNQLRERCIWQEALDRCDDPMVASLVGAHRSGTLPATLLRPAFERAIAKWWVEHRVGSVESLRTFRGVAQDELVRRFRALDSEIKQVARDEVRARLVARIPPLSGPGEMAVLRGELKRQRGHMPIRKLFSKISHALTRLKPCVLMSPLSVAQYLDPALELFDVIVFDEASQIPPWDAVGAIARGRQMVVVGDSKQLPPTTFFQTTDDEIPDDDDMVELESVLDECIRSGFATRSLRWHYRSRHESLIAFSNHHYYDNRLNTFPSAAHEVPQLGVKWVYVADGFYDKGRSRTNQAEASRVVEEIERRLSDPTLRGKSVGVVTFSRAQQMAIEDGVDGLRRRRPDLEGLLSDAPDEPLFIKNLENVQGDERDVMLFSICYGPDRLGRVAMNFGPLNRDGGERRLNVAVTRARELLIVFSSLLPDQIDLARTSAVGVAHLKTFLDYAKRGTRAIDEAVALDRGAEFDSPFEEAVCQALRARGWVVDIQVGCAGYRIDMAVKDPARPGCYLLGVECDGATYHSVRAARDRDRIRASVLEGLGWTLFRIWSPEWWRDKAAVMRRLEATLNQAKARSESNVPVAPPEPVAVPEQAGTADGGPDREDVLALLEAAEETATVLPDTCSTYVYADARGEGTVDEWEDAPLNQVGEVLRLVVEVEGPVHVREAARRVGEAWGLERLSKKTVRRVLQACDTVPNRRRPQRRGEFLWAPGQNPDTWREFRVPVDDGDRRDAAHLPPEEIANAASWILSRAGSIPHSELVTELARLFGFRSTGKKVREAVTAGIAHLVASGRAREDGDQLRP